MDKVTLRAIDDWKHTGFGADVQALLIAQDDSDTGAQGAARDARAVPGRGRDDGRGLGV